MWRQQRRKENDPDSDVAANAIYNAATEKSLFE
jgi:hypothetical protein